MVRASDIPLPEPSVTRANPPVARLCFLAPRRRGPLERG